MSGGVLETQKKSRALSVGTSLLKRTFGGVMDDSLAKNGVNLRVSYEISVAS